MLWDAITNSVCVFGKNENELHLEATKENIDLPWFCNILVDDINQRIVRKGVPLDTNGDIVRFCMEDYPFTHQTKRRATYGKNRKIEPGNV